MKATSFQKLPVLLLHSPRQADDIGGIYENAPSPQVREGEFATAENSAGVQKVGGGTVYNAALEGLQRQSREKSPPPNLKCKQNVARQQVLEQTYTGISERGNLNVENVMGSFA